MNREELDTLWFQAMRQSIEEGEDFIRYHFAALVADHEREACAKLADEFYREGMDYDVGAAIRARKQKISE